jgi:parallel beta-helix repeat protein
MVNGKELGFFHNQSNIDMNVDQYGQVIFLNCNNTIIQGGVFRNCTSGIQVWYCNNITIEESIVEDCRWFGIQIENSEEVTIRNCNVARCYSGIVLSHSPFCKITHCVTEDNTRTGIGVSNNGTVINCIIRGNQIGGLGLTDNATAIGNNVSYNARGISIYGGHCLVVNNTVTYNNGTGIYISDVFSSDNAPYFNRLYGNRIGWNGRNARDYGTFNEWDDGVGIGNYWSDYYGIGVYEFLFGVDHYPRKYPEGSIPQFHIDAGIAINLIGLFAILFIAGLKEMFFSEKK